MFKQKYMYISCSKNDHKSEFQNFMYLDTHQLMRVMTDECLNT